MTRLDPAGEPSMEDILASIRRIIAEDPPGSRAGTEAPVAAKSEPSRAQPLDSASPLPTAPALSSRVEPSFMARPAERAVAWNSPTGKREVEAIPAATEPSQPSIDDQLADVLGTVRSVTSAQPAERGAQAAPQVSVSPVQAALDSLMPAKAETLRPAAAAAPLPAAPQPGPSFTFSRDGYVPPAVEPAPSVETRSAAADPFEFSLGPSPFARSPEPSKAAPAQQDMRSADPFGAIVPTRDVLQVSTGAGASPVADAQSHFAERPQPDFGAMSARTAPFLATPEAEPQALPPQSPTFRAAFDPVPEPPLTATQTPAFVAPEPVAPAAPSVATAFIPVPGPIAAPQPAAAPMQSSPARPFAAPSLGEIATPPGAPAANWQLRAEPVASLAPAAAPAPAPSIPAPQAFTPSPVFPAAPAYSPQAPSPQIASAPPAAIEPVFQPAPASVAEQAAEPAPASAEAAQAILEQIARPAAAPSEQSGVTAQAEEPVSLLPAAPVVETADEEAVFSEALHEEDGSDAPPSEPLSPAPDLPAKQALIETTDRAADVAAGSANAVGPPRTMEDTVAELLRPMLRNWLAENMPKIVEKALRKELDDSVRSEHKPAAE